MNKQFKKVFGVALSLAMVAGSIVLPMSANAEDYTPLFAGDTVLKEWKLEFGAKDTTPQAGYTLVSPDAYLNPIAASDYDYGFMGTNEEDYNFTNRYDGWGLQKGQVIELEAGDDGGIGVVGAGGTEEKGGVGNDIYGNQADKFYPVRFGMKVPDKTNYRVKATVGAFDSAKDATVSLYTERKHPIFTEKTIEAGDDPIEITFSVRVNPLYYEKSEPKGTIEDRMLTVGVLGENSALISLEIQQVESVPIFWILGDSTVTDGNTTLPYFPLQNYTGYGTGFMKYLPGEYAMVNAGEGGLASGDVNHFNIVQDSIKAGDYLFFEYGHNETVDSFKGNLNKYYNLTHGVGAKLIISSPAERINNWNSTENKYIGALEGYQTASEEFAAAKVADGADDIAFVGLSTASINFINKVVADNNNSKDAIRYYYRTTSGNATDTTHFNDIGAENIAYLFFEEAKKVTDITYEAVLAPIIDNMTDEVPNPVPAEILQNGVASGAWPQYIVPSDEKYPVKINDISFNEDGEAVFASVTVRDATIAFNQYGIVVITVFDEDGEEKGKIYSTIQVDNSTGLGEQKIEQFTTDVVLEDGDTYSAVVLEAYRDDDNKIVLKENGVTYSAVYKPTDVAAQLLINSRNEEEYENFDYFGATYDGTTSFVALNDNGWAMYGSSGKTAVLNEDNGVKYADMSIDGVKNGSANQGSFTMAKPLSKKVETKGRYMVSADIRYVSGGGTTFNLTSNYAEKNMYGTNTQYLFTVGAEGKVGVLGNANIGTVSATDFTNVQAILDCDLATLEVTVEGNDPVTVQLDNYNTTELTVTPDSFTYFMFGGEKVEWHINVANLQVAKLKDKKLPEYTASAAASDTAHGTVSISDASTLKYADGKAIVNAGSKCVLIEAKYADGKLADVKLTEIASGKGEVEVTEGSKLMLWETVNGLKPLADAITAAETEDVTYPLNTVMQTSVTVDEGYVFMGWYNGDVSNSDNLLSMDADYKFRLRGNTVLTAKIVPEPTLADITTFAISAAPASIKSKVGQTTTMKISDAADANKTPMTKITNADMTWACAETGITISADGVLTVGENFSMGSALTKTITVTGTINGITKSCQITIFGYEYFENMAEGSTNYNGTFMTIAGKTAIVFPGASTTKTYTMTEPVALDATTTVKYDHAWSGTNTCGQLRTLNFKNSKGEVIFSMYYSWGGLFVGGTELAGAISKDAWATATVEINPETKVVTVTAAGSTATTTLADNAGDIAGIDFVSDAVVPDPSARALGISNITIIK